MEKGYKDYLEAVKNCKRDEMTLYDSEKKKYYNKKGIVEPREGFR